ncbi:MAG TPA: hypothetical protein VMT24_05505 [Aggregatilineaceae bacterium]|nr:hypothetical protein [Aggregatilineaceae bacterium]
MSDTTMSASSVCACTTRATIPTFDRQQTSASASTSAWLSKQRGPYLTKAPVFQDGAHTLYGPNTGLVTGWDVWIESISWTAPGGLDEVVELKDGAGATIWRATAQALDDSNFAFVKISRLVRGGYSVPTLDSGVLLVKVGRSLRNA